jgi:hypothetical protein
MIRANGEIGRLTTSGTFHLYFAGVFFSHAITVGPDGAVWWANLDGGFGRITTTPGMTLSPSSGGAGTPLGVSGRGYDPGEQVTVTYDTGLASPASAVVCTTTANPDGTFSCDGTVPAAPTAGASGPHTIAAIGATTNAEADATFTLS